MSDLKSMSYEEKRARANAKHAVLEKSLANTPLNVQRMYKNVPTSMQRTFLDVHCEISPTNKQRIKLKCLDCSAWQRDEVTKCVVEQCALWAVRPYQKKG